MHIARLVHAVQSIAESVEHPLIALARDFVVLLPFFKVKGENLRHNGVDVYCAADAGMLVDQGQNMLAMMLLDGRHHLNLMLSSFFGLSIFMWNFHGVGLRLPLHLVDSCICTLSELLANSPKFRWLTALLHLDHGLTTLTLQFRPSFWVKPWGQRSGPVQVQLLRELILHRIRHIFIGQVILIMPQCGHHHREHQRTNTNRNHFERAKYGEMSRLSG
mmetsp:Transcript_1013/g.1724  ORF Transcript_1013/g.1724 Transcript_1013/m.1724 type:complete len:218 (+) Transcript_1013:383-1036(+)